MERVLCIFPQRGHAGIIGGKKDNVDLIAIGILGIEIVVAVPVRCPEVSKLLVRNTYLSVQVRIGGRD